MELGTNTSLADDFRDCIALFNAYDVVFVLVGGYAVGWHGVVRATGDIDFLYQRTIDNVARLCDALREFGAPQSLIDPDFMMSPGAVTQIGLVPLRIDLLASISGVSFEQVLAGANETKLDGQRLRVIGLDELLANKLSTNRPRDRDDARRLAKLRPRR